MRLGDIRRGGEGTEEPPVLEEAVQDEPLDGPTSGRFWSASVIGGSFSTLFVFVFLGYLQPTMSSSEAITLPDIVQLQTGLGSNRKPPPPPKEQKQEKAERKSRPKRAKKVVRQKIARSKPTRAQQGARQLNPLASMNMNINLSLGGGSGTAMAIGLPTGQAGFEQEAREVEEYVRTRERAKRDSYDRGRGGSARGAFGGSGVTPPRLIHRPRMPYPPRARKEEIEGFVMVKVLVSANGSISEFEILGARPEDVFEDVVINSLAQWRFSPAKDSGGRPIEIWKEYNIKFRLEDR